MIQLQETPQGMGLVDIPEQGQQPPEAEGLSLNAQAPPAPMSPHPAKGKYGPIINYVFGERVEEYAPEGLAPIIQAIQQEMRGKSGFIQFGEQVFYKNGSMIEAVENPMMVPEEAKILNLDKKA
jgi:hypothetical protein